MFTQEVADQICECLAGGMSLRKACERVEGSKVPTVLLWVDSRPEFAEQYTRARSVGYALLADEILEISTAPSHTEDTAVCVARSRLEVDSRKWMLSKMLPKVYGDKLDLNHSGRIATSREMTEEELASIAAGSSS